MARRDDILDFCDELLDVAAFDDYGPNGLQVPADPEVGKVVTGVSAHRELIERAIGAEAQLLITHHGLFWDFLPRALSEPMAERLRLALGARLSVAGYHLPPTPTPRSATTRSFARRSDSSPQRSRSAQPAGTRSASSGAALRASGASGPTAEFAR